MYFWENNLDRAKEWARNNPKIEKPTVIGAIIDLGYCLDFIDSQFLADQCIKSKLYKRLFYTPEKEYTLAKSVIYKPL